MLGFQLSCLCSICFFSCILSFFQIVPWKEIWDEVIDLSLLKSFRLNPAQFFFFFFFTEESKIIFIFTSWFMLRLLCQQMEKKKKSLWMKTFVNEDIMSCCFLHSTLFWCDVSMIHFADGYRAIWLREQLVNGRICLSCCTLNSKASSKMHFHQHPISRSSPALYRASARLLHSAASERERAGPALWPLWWFVDWVPM